MSATRDKSQKVTFVYQNLHALYRQGLAAAKAAPSFTPNSADRAEPLTGVIRGKILKVDQIAAEPAAVVTHEPALLMGKRLGSSATEAVPPSLTLESQRQAIQSLQDNLKTLGDLHSRLRFMLKELEELVKE